MSQTVARRYARALHKDAESKEAVTQVDDDMEMIQASLEGSAELRRFFDDPMIPSDKKTRVLDALFEKRIHAATLTFLQLLVKKGRDNILPAIVAAYKTLRNQQQGIVEAQVRAALPLNEAEKKRIISRIESMTGKNVKLDTEIDASILGGLIIRVGDMVYDGSLNHQLETLKDRLEYSTYMAN